MSNYCTRCYAGDEQSVYPYYGRAPHNPHLDHIPENFIPDGEDATVGTYTHCLDCGAGREPLTVSKSDLDIPDHEGVFLGIKKGFAQFAVYPCTVDVIVSPTKELPSFLPNEKIHFRPDNQGKCIFSKATEKLAANAMFISVTHGIVRMSLLEV